MILSQPVLQLPIYRDWPARWLECVRCSRRCMPADLDALLYADRGFGEYQVLDPARLVTHRS